MRTDRFSRGLRSNLSLVSAALAACAGLAGCGAAVQTEPVAATPVSAPAGQPAPGMFDQARRISSAGALAAISAPSTDLEEDTADNLVRATFSADGADFDPDVSRDGKWLVFSSTQHRPNASLYIKPVSGRTVTQLTNDDSNHVMPSFSPDGTRVAFASNRAGSWDIYIVATGGGQPIQVTSDSAHELHPTWSPDGKQLAFCRLNPGSGRWEIWTVDAANPGAARFLTHGLLPEWSPTSDTIAFQRSRERGERLYSVWTIDIVENEAVNPTEIASDPEFAYLNPCWSPDGRRLAFAAVPATDVKGPVIGGLGVVPSQSSIWMVNSDGSARTRLTGGTFVDVMPRWSNDNKIYFVSNRAGAENVWALTPGRAIATASFDGPAKTGRRTENAKAPSKPSGARAVAAKLAKPSTARKPAPEPAAPAPAHAEDHTETAHAPEHPAPMFLDPNAGGQPADAMANAPAHGDDHAGDDEPH